MTTLEKTKAEPRPVVVTATQANRGFSSILERAKYGESFEVVKNGELVARILPPVPVESNGAAIMAFLESWVPDPDGFTDEVITAVESCGEPNERDEERIKLLTEPPWI